MSDDNENKNFDQFIDDWEPIEHPTGDYGTYSFEYGNEKNDTLLEKYSEGNPNKVWTVVSGDTNEFICPGYRFVNRLHYIITKKARPDNWEKDSWDKYEYIYWDSENEDNN